MHLSLSGLKWASVIVQPPETPLITLMTLKVVGSSCSTDRRESRSVGRLDDVGLDGGAVMSYICRRKSSSVLESESKRVKWNAPLQHV
jgi:hypothetical protein